MYSGVEIQNLISSYSYGKHDFGNVCQKKVPSDVQNKKKKLEQNVAAGIGMSENNNYGQFNNVINQQATFFGETCHISPNIFKAWACFF